MEAQRVCVAMRGISKVFGKVVANHNVNIEFYEGEVHALLGENGAGKSTLMNMLAGIYTPDRGCIEINGSTSVFSSPADAIRHGIGMIHQHFKLVEAMTALENIMVGERTGFFLSQGRRRTRVEEVAARFGLWVDLDRRVYDMSVGEKQILAILQVLCRGARVLVLDEPTTVFTPQETKNLFAIIRRMKAEGCTIIFISHKMDEVMEISDRITVLRKGETIQTLDKHHTNPRHLTELMVGRAVDLSIERTPVAQGDLLLEIADLVVADDLGHDVLHGITLQLRAGEILGIAGIANSGQRELCESIVGMMKIRSGSVLFCGEELVGLETREIIARGISMSFIPEDRLGMGLVASMDMVDNVLLKSYHHQKSVLIDRKSISDRCRTIIEKLDIKTPGVHHPIRDLSGGNIQKILLGRELDSSPKVLIMAYPTRGLDINTCHTIYDLMNEQKKAGVGIIFIGEELDVLIQLSDRIAVMCRGEITGEVDASGTTREELGLLMVGQRNEETAGEPA